MAGLLSLGSLSAFSSVSAEEGPNYGAGRTLTGSRGPNYGGGQDYVEQLDANVTVDDANYVVKSDEELADALDVAEYGDVVFVPGDAEIDTHTRSLTSRGPPGYHVPEGVTLASDRGVDGSSGGLIYSDDSADGWPEEGWKIAVHSDARVTGLRIRGPYWDSEEVVPTTYGKGVLLWDGDWFADPGTTTNVEVDNCEFAGWSSGCVTQSTGADDCRVHHCDFHDTLIAGLGYGVTVSEGTCEIDHNTFNRHRHAIASGGDESAGYDLHHNVFGEHTLSHVIDVHDPGGDRFDIHHNTVRSAYKSDGSGDPAPAVTIRGAPQDAAWIHHNWFHNPHEPRENPHPEYWTNEAITQVLFEGGADGNPHDEWANVKWKHVQFGEEEPRGNAIGAPHADKVEW